MGVGCSNADTNGILDEVSCMQCGKRRRDESERRLHEDIGLIIDIPLFAFLGPEEAPRLAVAFSTLTFRPGETVVRQGELRAQFFVVRAGKAAVKIRRAVVSQDRGVTDADACSEISGSGAAVSRRSVDRRRSSVRRPSDKSVLSPDGEPAPVKRGRRYSERRVSQLRDGLIMSEPEQVSVLTVGDHFGEGGLMGNTPQDATVEATTHLEVLVLDRSTFLRLGLQDKLHFRKRQAVCEGRESWYRAPDPESQRKSESVQTMLMDCMLDNENLNPFLDNLIEQELDELVAAAFRVDVKEGEEVVKQGEPAELFYMIEDGLFEEYTDGLQQQVLGSGRSFGELALVYRTQRPSTVKAATKGTLWALPRQVFRQVARSEEQKVARVADFLGKVDLLSETSEDDRVYIADALVEQTFYRDEYIIRQGEIGTCLIILYEGTVAKEMNGQEVCRLEADPAQDRFECFVERALLNKTAWCSSVKAVSERVTAMVLDYDTFKRVLQQDPGDIQAKCMNYLDKQEKAQYSMSNLQEIGLLGTGSFATVTLVKDKESGHTFALKALSKGLMYSTGNVQSVKREKLVLQTTRSPFLVRLAATFSSEQHLYFLLEPCLGGDIFTVYRRNNFFGSEVHARFYTACAARGLQHLHERHILYRDLKMENMVLDARGYCKLTDFGLSTFAVGHAYSLCGTPEIMAPEIVAGSGHTCAADWWSCGIVVYECMVGTSPFGASDIITIFHKIQGGIEQVTAWPGEGKSAWPSLVKELCSYEPSERLPMRKRGVVNVTEHLWYTSVDFDWQAHGSCTLKAPYSPGVRGAEDRSHFDALWEERPDHVDYKDDGSGWDDGFADMRGRRIY
eukprot:TRINITY_DN90468_c0_g1_i1.p1 TRINITY_DN90468_c0_g1~~TRINITY_DN90468_c0_g1_i1.p1  ORF type:complete len:848 (-),score=210.08 TRINITY_DN90468_c0_g1_i1:286-2829(-)